MRERLVIRGGPVREPIVLNMRFDRMLIPLAAVMTEALAFAGGASSMLPGL